MKQCGLCKNFETNDFTIEYQNIIICAKCVDSYLEWLKDLKTVIENEKNVS